ncbi:hypothetical protein SteCoe_18286 [Stentor coeruleus]|uniref:Homologous-pairing protein 2 winged helix domain-containing protein n=1 Tax=Stentor coeruleus TaxID=5963 RepID=A0A1R2BWV6_9CILI|nr:hypothetical protein SteCoe_18286 [Stentor coeruleus]
MVRKKPKVDSQKPQETDENKEPVEPKEEKLAKGKKEKKIKTKEKPPTTQNNDTNTELNDDNPQEEKREITEKKGKSHNNKKIVEENKESLSIEADPGENHGLKGDEAVVFEYMFHQNRPYSLLNIFDNLRGAIKKPQMQKVLDKLVENGKFQSKEYGKVKIYLVNQQLIPEISQTELEELDHKIAELNEELETIRTEVKELQIQTKELENALSLEEIQKQLEDNKNNLQNLDDEIKIIQDAGCVSEDMRKDIEGKLKIVMIEEKKRDKVWTGLLGGIAEMLDMPIKKAKEMIGVD